MKRILVAGCFVCVAAMAAVVGNELWLGSFYANRLAYRTLK